MDNALIHNTLIQLIASSKSQKKFLDTDTLFYSENDFLNIIDRECARSDQYGHNFMLVTFQLDQGSEQASRMLTVLASRLCLSDVAGWVNEHYLGVLLSGVQEMQGTQYFLNSITHLFRQRYESADMPLHQVHHYPLDWHPELEREWYQVAQENMVSDTVQYLHAEERGAVLESPPSLDHLLIQAMPWWKRATDIVGASIGLLLLSPLFLLVAIYIKSISKGKVLFTQPRVGYLGKTFTIFKFRTMESNIDTSKHQHYVAELLKNGKPMYKLEDTDPKVIPYGNILRKTGIDEFPQLINVLRGEMSLVGPRPDVLYAVKNYYSWYHTRSDAYPGLTGLWQVSGKNNTSYEQMMALDVAYSRNIRFWLDLKIILSTPISILAQVKQALFTPKNPLGECKETPQES
ncbi:sugar transferase [Candidatus Venteria ishoeyi]|uniref:sugar transferase n=1 Tax=Candidatus Venteria ishoeyi TaxID=1899563 RepID=UPI0025A5197F|nr:sugar transferase [Candidatus Venteria ishoeyi]MDM8546964.1 sugar transferase [Candidatus Venteria ishoeyi]